MSRYTGPRLKVMRALGVDLPGLSRKAIEDRPNRPGPHGARVPRRSDFAIRLAEKQKLRFNYGLSERQIQRLFRESKSAAGPTGDKLLELLERRLDNLVFRAGFAPTIVAARQLIRHRHITWNGRIVNIPSIRVRPGDRVAPKPKSGSMPLIRETLESPPLTRPEWIAFDQAAAHATVMRLPERDDVPFPVDVQLVVEYYANRL